MRRCQVHKRFITKLCKVGEFQNGAVQDMSSAVVLSMSYCKKSPGERAKHYILWRWRFPGNLASLV